MTREKATPEWPKAPPAPTFPKPATRRVTVEQCWASSSLGETPGVTMYRVVGAGNVLTPEMGDRLTKAQVQALIDGGIVVTVKP